ncbi:hypothetical protein [Actinomadura sp. CNU-125]|uniref:hypothetical protein n=1 Tax=Actinomadura sp. CNU-125 TaxID=1904961 RepID=UPI0021CC53E6|nr:hypothetical protein [Actinomadura sp. CNU-125]
MGGCEQKPGAERVLHGRDVARAFLGDDEIIAVDVWQVKAVTPWRDGGTVFYPNHDEAPRVMVFHNSPDGEHTEPLSLSVPEAVTFVATLRATGADGLAGAVQNAVDLATAITEEARS